MDDRLFLGLDIGSLSCDAVLINDSEEIVAWSVVPTGAKNLLAIERARNEVCEKTGIDVSRLAATVATGYGRNRVEQRLAAVTEITCHARGARSLFPKVDILIDIGGQDSKVIRLGPNGRVVNFSMNDKCAAGTGRFLEAMARALEVDVDQLATMDEGATNNVSLSSMCTVFAESEVVSLIADGEDIHEIVRGLNNAIAARNRSLVKRVTTSLSGLNVAMSGGVARNTGVVRALSAAIGADIIVLPEPDIVGALGAALIAREKWMKGEG